MHVNYALNRVEREREKLKIECIFPFLQIFQKLRLRFYSETENLSLGLSIGTKISASIQDQDQH